MEVKLISKTEGVGEFAGRSIEDIIVYCARVSSDRADKFDKPDGLLKYCIKNKHWSIFETGNLTFEITTNLAIAMQLLRHRSNCFQMRSLRYTEAQKFEPIELRQQGETNRQNSGEIIDPYLIYGNASRDGFGEPLTCKASQWIEEHLQETMKLYNLMIEAGVARECARMILPMATQTTLYLTGNVRSIIHLLDVRDDENHAQAEIVALAREIKKIFKEQLPIISKALEY